MIVQEYKRSSVSIPYFAWLDSNLMAPQKLFGKIYFKKLIIWIQDLQMTEEPAEDIKSLRSGHFNDKNPMAVYNWHNHFSFQGSLDSWLSNKGFIIKLVFTVVSLHSCDENTTEKAPNMLSKVTFGKCPEIGVFQLSSNRKELHWQIFSYVVDIKKLTRKLKRVNSIQ